MAVERRSLVNLSIQDKKAKKQPEIKREKKRQEKKRKKVGRKKESGKPKK